MDDSAVREQVARVEALLGDLEALTDQAARSAAQETVAALVGLYGEVLARMVAHIAKPGAGAGADAVATACARDELVSQLLLVHGLHPDGVDARVRQALEAVRPALRAHGGDVELLGVQSGVVRLRLRGSCDGCASSAATLTTMVEQAIRAAAPEIDQVEAEGVPKPVRPSAGSAPAFVPLATVVAAGSAAGPATGRAGGKAAGRATGRAAGRATGPAARGAQEGRGEYDA